MSLVALQAAFGFPASLLNSGKIRLCFVFSSCTEQKRLNDLLSIILYCPVYKFSDYISSCWLLLLCMKNLSSIHYYYYMLQNQNAFLG